MKNLKKLINLFGLIIIIGIFSNFVLANPTLSVNIPATGVTLYSLNSDYNATRNVEAAQGIIPIYYAVGQYFRNNEYRIYRSLMTFDLSSIPKGSKINYSVLHAKGAPINTGNSFHVYTVVGEHSSSGITEEMYSWFPGWAWSEPYTLKKYDFEKDYAYQYTNQWWSVNFVANDWNKMHTFHSVGLKHVEDGLNKDGFLRVLLISNNDVNDIVPSNDEYVVFESDPAPYLEISYTLSDDLIAPSNLLVSNIKDTSASFKWDDNSNIEDGYIIEDLSGVVYGSFSANSTSAEIINLLQNTNYNLVVKAYKGNYKSVASNVVSFITLSSSSDSSSSNGNSSSSSSSSKKKSRRDNEEPNYEWIYQNKPKEEEISGREILGDIIVTSKEDEGIIIKEEKEEEKISLFLILEIIVVILGIIFATKKLIILKIK